MGKRPDLVEHAAAPADGAWSLIAARNISVQTRPTDTKVSSTVEGMAFETILLFLNIYIRIISCVLKASMFSCGQVINIVFFFCNLNYSFFLF